MISRIMMTTAIVAFSLLTVTVPTSALELFGASFGTSPSAHASATRSERVSFAGLNLNNETGARALLKRINAASDRVCDKPSLRDLQDYTVFLSCKGVAEQSAVSLVNHSTVTALYNRSPAVPPQGISAATAAK